MLFVLAEFCGAFLLLPLLSALMMVLFVLGREGGS